jgi:hypothetical protein
LTFSKNNVDFYKTKAEMNSTLESSEVSLTELLFSLQEGDSIKITVAPEKQNIPALIAILDNILYKNSCKTVELIRNIIKGDSLLEEKLELRTALKKRVIGPEWTAWRIQGHVEIEKA